MKSSTTLLQSPIAIYDACHDYYMSNGLYDDITKQLRANDAWGEAMRPLRNPAHRVVEFYVSKIWAGSLDDALPILTTNPNLLPAIKKVWQWSNFEAKKQLFSRWFAEFGDGFLKISANDDANRVVLHILDPRWITDFTIDQRGYIQTLRLDMQIEKDGKVVWWTEYWTKDEITIWDGHTKGRESRDKIGTPTKRQKNSLGFVPIVHVPFRDIGETRGMNCFWHTVDKIDEANRVATRLHQILFRYNAPIFAVEQQRSVNDPRPKPDKKKYTAGDTLEVNDEVMMALPENAKLHTLVPQLDYRAMLDILNALMDELEYDLPELKYYTVSKHGQASGVALRYLLGDAIDRVIEARGNAVRGLIRAHQIALTIGQSLGLEGFEQSAIGTYDDQSFDHTIADVPVIPLSKTDQATILTSFLDAGLPLESALREAGFSTSERTDILRLSVTNRAPNSASDASSQQNSSNELTASSPTNDAPNAEKEEL